MGPLIEISTVPIQIEMKTTSAKLERASGTAEMEFTRSDKGVSVRSRAVRVNLDTYETGSSRTVSPITQMRQATYETASAYTNQGQLMMTSHLAGAGLPVQAGGVPARTADAPAQTVAKTAGTPAQASPAMQNAVPAAAAELDLGEMSIRYEMDKLNFDWKFGQSEFEFTPGDIEFTVTQRPEVVIKYIGGPLYVPPSADPNYEGVDVTV